MLGVVPARGGSKRVPRKNIRNVAGKPLIAHTVEQAIRTDLFEKVVVSTDDDEIADIAEQYGASVPFKRPEALATDDASTDAVVSHALDWFEDRGSTFDAVCVLQVTSPLRSDSDVCGAVEKFAGRNAGTLVSVTEYQSPPQFALEMYDDGTLGERFDPEMVFSDQYVRSQDLDTLYCPNGAIYIADTDTWDQYERFYTPETVGYEMPPERAIDIDHPWEIDVVECLLGDESNPEPGCQDESNAPS
ncbi:cytidylyltransferase domain-containing protein [Halorientalis pallida]|uniref:acylneuraminate cytidylyltransferase family protein n=1 Tax=Halorientalis pallida TaxID=2479928 RepID=UPI003C6F1053